MITFVKLNNYRSLNDVVFDFKETKEKTKKLVAIYGENGCGKSNFIRSIYFLKKLINSFELEKSETKIMQSLDEKEIQDWPLRLQEMFGFSKISNMFANSRTIDCNENTRMEFGFDINGHEANYIIEFNDSIEYEKLYYFTGKQSGLFFEVKKGEIKSPQLSNLIFKSKKVQADIKDLILKFWGKHSLLAIIFDLLNKYNDEYVKDNFSKNMADFCMEIMRISINLKVGAGGVDVPSAKDINFISELENGNISLKNEWLLKNTEAIINDFFTQSYSDIKKVYFETKKEKDRLAYHLYFLKNINGKNRIVPVEQESTGTRKILDVLRNLFGAFCGCTVVIDEIDNGVHDLLLKVIIDSMKDYITGQLIFTTHNTSLLESLEPKMVYLINSDYQGRKDIICLSEFKLQDHNSPRIRYLKGLYGGVPFVDSLDYLEIINNLNKQGKNHAK